MSEGTRRKLAAVVSADVAGYSRLMGQDERGTLAALKAHRAELIDGAIASRGGRIVKTTGDGMLAEFPSVVDAVECCIAVQEGMAKRNAGVAGDAVIRFRIGIHLGDIIVDGDDIYGDGVNIAARLQELGAPGGVAVSGIVHDYLDGTLAAGFLDLGERDLKNIRRPIRVWQRTVGADDGDPAPMAPTLLALPDKPSIAVLPFDNMSGDPEQDYFSDGLTEDVITELSRFKELFVIARNSSFTYKDQAVDVKQIGRELGVRYVLEGSVRKAGTQLRITGQLIDAVSGNHIWADRFDGALDDVFELQDRVTTSLVGAISPQLRHTELERARRKPTTNLTAYDCFLRGLARTRTPTKAAYDEALVLFGKAIDLDPDYAYGYSGTAWVYTQRKAFGLTTDARADADRTAQMVARAVDLGHDDANILSVCGYASAYVAEDLEAGSLYCERAILLNTNLAHAWNFYGYINLWRGDPEQAIENIRNAVRLSPVDPWMFVYSNITAHAHFMAGRFEAAASWAARAIRERDAYLPALRVHAASLGMLGKQPEADRAVSLLLRAAPTFCVSKLRAVLGPYRRDADILAYEDGLRRAGLPE